MLARVADAEDLYVARAYTVSDDILDIDQRTFANARRANGSPKQRVAFDQVARFNQTPVNFCGTFFIKSYVEIENTRNVMPRLVRPKDSHYSAAIVR